MIRLSSYVELLYDKGITKQYLRGLYTVVQSLHEFLEGKYKLSKRKWFV